MTSHIDLIASYEGFSPEPFWDYHQWSIGHGSYAGSRNRNQKPNVTVTEQQARAMLQEQIGTFEQNVDSYNSQYNWTPNERAALISFAYNIGSIDQLTANGTRSKEEIAQKMLLYNKAGGQELSGLTKRRIAEQQLFTGGNPILPESAPTNVVGIDTELPASVEGANSTGVANATSDFAAANNTSDLWQIAENSGNFWDNELDNFDYYTYNLEFFVVDELSAIKFLADDYNLDDVANNAWPNESMKRVVVAWTGATTEFNIQDLQVESLGTGSQSGARMSGTATKLNFNIIQVGRTNLNDSLQNAAVLMGFTSIHDATWFIKINFIGYENGNPNTIKATKVLPFKLSDFGDLQTSTDARGTSTILNGTIILQNAFMSTINVIDYPFNFKVKDTLKETLDDFFSELGKSISLQNFSGDEKFINTYSYIIDPDFEQYMSSAMNGANPNLSSATNDVATTNGNVNISQQSGNVSVGSNIFNIVADICNQSLSIREELTESRDTFSNIINVTPIAIAKQGGLNIVTNTRGHEVTYHIGMRRVPLYQNQTDAVLKAQNSAKMIDEIFTQGRCRKRYYYHYTGLNDQILDFQVSLNKQLTKAYVAPTDEYAYANFISVSGMGDFSLNQLNSTAQQAITSARQEQAELTGDLTKARTNLDSLRNNLDNEVNSIQADFIDQIQGVLPGDVSSDDFFGDTDSLSETMRLINDFSGGEFASNVLNDDRVRKLDQLVTDIEANENTSNNLDARLRTEQSKIDSAMQQGIGALLSNRQQEIQRRPDDNFQAIARLDENLVNDGSFVLLEELSNDFIKRLTTEEFNSLINTMLTSPNVFRRVIIPKLLDVNRSTVLKSSSPEDLEIARQRYYEGLNADISMQQLSITIKGDPFWLNNYIPPDKARSTFGVNATNENYKNDNSVYTGFNYCMIINNAAAGTDELMNTKIENLLIDVYLVKSITSSFSGGLFTQTLNMVKKNFPKDFRALNPTIDAELGTLDNTGGDTGMLDGNDGDIGVDVGGGTGEGEPGPGAYKVVTGSGQSKRYTIYDADGNVVSEGRGNGPNLPNREEYENSEDLVNGTGIGPLVDIDAGTPVGGFDAATASEILGSDDPFDPRGSKFSSYGDATGMAPRTVDTEIPPNTLTPDEMEAAVSIQREIRRLTTETPLMKMSDTEYARVKQLEAALDEIVDNSTTGLRGEVRDEIIQREKRSELASAQDELAEVEDDLDGFYFTNNGRREDEEQRAELEQQILEQQTEISPVMLTEVKTIVNPETGEREDVPEYIPGPVEGRPIIIPKPDGPLPQPYIDNGDGTITVEGSNSITNPEVDSEEISEILGSTLSLEEQQEYIEAIESNNGIKVHQFVESLPEDKKIEVLQLEETREWVKLPGDTVDMSNPAYKNIPESSAKQLDAANSIMQNFQNQMLSLPRVEKSYTFPDGTVETWTDPDFTQLQPVPYVDANGNVQTFNPLDYFPSPSNEAEFGYSPTVQRRMMQGLVEGFPALDIGDSNKKQPGVTTLGGYSFTVVDDNEQDENNETGGQQQ